MRFAILSMALLVGCGSAPVEGAGTASLSGAQSFVAKTVFAGSTHSAATPIIVVSMSSLAQNCPAAGSGLGISGGDLLFFQLISASSAAISTGTYPVSLNAPASDAGAFAQFLVTTDTGSDYVASQGTVAISELDANHVAGSFTAQIALPDAGDPGMITGSFDAPFCAGLP
jgi:hypothetical protein